MGKRKRRQESMWVAVSDLPASPGHPFYQRLNVVLDAAGFDAFVEKQCLEFYAPRMGRPSLTPGRYFRLLLLGYFEGLDSERGIAWRASDSLAIRSFLGLALDETAPDHSTISRNRRLIDVETHDTVFTWVLTQLATRGLLEGRTIAIDATTLEANAAMRSIVHRETGEGYEEYLRRLAKASGLKTPSRAALARLDRRRKKKASNAEWMNPSDPDAKITRMKDGRTHFAHKAEHAVDIDSGALVAIALHEANLGDTDTIEHTLGEATKQLDAAIRADGSQSDPEGPAEVVADKGYHSDGTLGRIAELGLRSYVSEPNRGKRKWTGDEERRDICYANRRRIRGERGKRLHRKRGERVERSFAHMYETGRMRRTHLRGHENVLKRLLIHGSAFNLGLLLRTLFGVGTPKALQGVVRAVLGVIHWLRTCLLGFTLMPWRHWTFWVHASPMPLIPRLRLSEGTFTTGC